MDAIDAALVDFDAAPLRVIAPPLATKFEPALKRRVSALIDRADSAALDEVGQIDVGAGARIRPCGTGADAKHRSRRRPDNGHRQPWADAAPSA